MKVSRRETNEKAINENQTSLASHRYHKMHSPIDQLKCTINVASLFINCVCFLLPFSTINFDSASSTAASISLMYVYYYSLCILCVRESNNLAK